MRSSKGTFSALRGSPLVLILACSLVISCTESDDEILLVPTGEVTVGSGVVSGTLTFDGAPPSSEATVLAIGAYVPSCNTNLSSIHMTGTINDWDTGTWNTTPGMHSLGGCVWFEEREFESGDIEWKWVTDKAWDTPPDYVSIGSDEALSGFVDATSGENIKASIPADGIYYLFLIESTDPAAYSILTEDEAPLDKSDLVIGEFEILDLPAGTYEIIVLAEGFLDFHLSGVVLGEDEAKDLGTLNVISATGVIRGQVGYSDNPGDPPRAFVEALPAGGSSVAASDSTDDSGTFEILGLQTGTYDLRVSAGGYLTRIEPGIEYVNGEETDAGTITLEPGCSTEFTLIEALGDFNNWTASAPMTEISPCVWVDTVRVATVGDTSTVLFMKFRTDGAWDSPQDFGTCTTQDEVHELEGDICRVSGEGTALAVEFPFSADYEFTLFEGTSTYRITALAEVEPGNIAGTVTYEDDPADPPTATVRYFRAGSSNQLGSVSTGAEGTFLIEELAAGLYDLQIVAAGYESFLVEDVDVTEGSTTDIGTVELVVLAECTPSMSIEISAELTGWPAEGEGPQASLVGDCQWAIVLPVDVSTDEDSTFVFRFRTNEREGEDDYGSCVGQDFVYEFQNGVVRDQVCVINGPVNNIKVKFPLTGNYVFVLDEQKRIFGIALLE
jgi:hypothetical protein